MKPIRFIIQIPLEDGAASAPLLAADGRQLHQFHVDMDIDRADAQRLAAEFAEGKEHKEFYRFVQIYYEPAIAHILATLKERGKL